MKCHHDGSITTMISKIRKSALFKVHFFGPNALGNSFFLAHMKFKSKITYLGTGISRIHRQMTEQWSFEVTVKNVTEEQEEEEHGTSILFV